MGKSINLGARNDVTNPTKELTLNSATRRRRAWFQVQQQGFELS
jgi:hypothetical protein